MANKGYHFGTSGNTKLGRMLVFNKLAGSGMIDGCMGSCGKHCTGCYNPEDPMKSACYVFKSYRQYGKNTTNWHIQNTQGLRTEPNVVFDSLANQMSRMRVTRPVRIHASGEIETAEELLKWFWMAKKFPKFAFYIYTKNYEVVDEVLSSHNIPNNFFLNISIWHEDGIECFNKWKNRTNVRAFVYMDGYEYPFKVNAMCPAYGKDGKMNHDKQCASCGICFQSKAKICGCLSH